MRRRAPALWAAVFVCLVGFTGCGDDDSNGDPCETADCDALATCTADGASYTCECPAGYDDVNDDGTECTDIDECTDGLDDCDPAATCTNADGGYTCECPSGYDDVNDDGTDCADIDECTDGLDDCDDVAVCANEEPGFTCTCPLSYTDVNGDGTLCEPPACTAEGDSHPVTPDADPCCDGTVDVGCDAPDGVTGQCLGCDGASYCTNCGDGICGPEENECRCPADCPPPACTAEGDSHAVVPGADPCCGTLVDVGCDAPDPGTGQCLGCTGASYCTNCGDGICGLGENECRCPADCAPASCTPEGGSHGVYPGAPSCCPGLTVIGCDTPDANGQCTIGCAGAVFCTYCGDGNCDSPENQCNCPADCPMP